MEGKRRAGGSRVGAFSEEQVVRSASRLVAPIAAGAVSAVGQDGSGVPVAFRVEIVGAPNPWYVGGKAVFAVPVAISDTRGVSWGGGCIGAHELCHLLGHKAHDEDMQNNLRNLMGRRPAVADVRSVDASRRLRPSQVFLIRTAGGKAGLLKEK